MDKGNKAIIMAGTARKLAINTINLWLLFWPLSTANNLGVGNIWRAFDKIKMDLLNLKLEAERDGEKE